MRLRNAYFVLLLFLTMQGCVGTQIDSFTNPAFSGVAFQNVFVYTNVANVEWRRDIEEQLVSDMLTKTDASAIKSLEFVTLTYHHTGQKVAELAHASRVDSVLWVNVVESGTHPKTFCIQGDPDTGFGASCSEFDMPHASFDVFLLNAKKADSAAYDYLLANRRVGQLEDFSQTGVAWASIVETSSKNILSWDIIWDRFSSELVGALIRDGLLEERH